MTMGENIKNISIPSNAVEAFKGFLDSFNKKESYILCEKTELFTQENIDATYSEFCSNSQDDNGKDKKFEDVINAIKVKKPTNLNAMIDIINHAVWLWALPNDRKAPWVIISPKKGMETYYVEELKNINGVAGGGPGYVMKKTNGIRFVLFLIKKIIEETTIEAKQCIIDACNVETQKYGNNNNEYDIPDGVKNLLLHLCDQNSYAPIAATADKKKIVRKFWEYIDEEKPKNKKNALDNLDDTVIKIKSLFSNGNNDFSFYANSLPLLWKGESDTDLSLVQQLEYKKAMILYGPPGTSKTYTAKELAIDVLFRYLMKNHKSEAINILKNNHLSELRNRVKVLQFHINYNYEDFIAGQTIEKDCVKTKKGFIFDIINEAKKTLVVGDVKIENDEKVPYVVILDEINRTDISRVFGEFFSAIENRGEDVELMLPDTDTNSNFQKQSKLKLNIPDNIYFIGTMNEIDFSLERVDFALRRRFIWELHDYKKETLKDIIYFKLNKAIKDKAINDYSDIDSTDIEDYCNKSTAINKNVEEAMGEAYHIGHAFFAEIADIYINLKKENNTDEPWKKAKDILWNISIKPTLEAYCGSMEKSEKEQYLKINGGKFCDVFLGKDKE